MMQRIGLEHQEMDQFVLMRLQFYISQCTVRGMENLWTVGVHKLFDDGVITYLHAFTPITRDDAVKMVIAELQRQHDEMQAYRKQREEEQEQKARQDGK